MEAFITSTTPRWDGTTYDGCTITWRANPNDPLVAATYRIRMADDTLMGAITTPTIVVFAIDTMGVYVTPRTIEWDVLRGGVPVTSGFRRIHQSHDTSPYCWQ